MVDNENLPSKISILKVSTLINYIESEVTPTDLRTIIQAENLIESILSNFLETKKSENSEALTIEDVINTSAKNQPVLIESNEQVNIKKLLILVETLRAIHKKINRLKTEFNEKLIHDLSNPSKDVWHQLNEFITNKLNHFHDYSKIENKKLKLKLNTWVEAIIKELKIKLEKSIKDFLHSEINKSIILSKIKGTDGWRFKLADDNNSKHNPLKNYEIAIKKEIDTLLVPYQAPFIEQFSKELFSRCYKQLLSTEKESITSSSIKTKITDISHQDLQNLKLETNVKIKFNNEYKALLDYLITNETNIKQYAKDKLSVLKSIANDDLLTDKEKKDIKTTFFQIYHSIRKYEKANHFWKNKITETKAKTNTEMFQLLIQSLEASIHRFRPFLVNHFNQLKNVLSSGNLQERKAIIKQYETSLESLQRINETMDLVRLINKHQHLLNEETITQLITQLPAQMTTLLKESITPWTAFNWLPILTTLCNEFNLNQTVTTQNNRIIKTFKQPEKATTSSLIDKTPTTEQKTTSNLSNQG